MAKEPAPPAGNIISVLTTETGRECVRMKLEFESVLIVALIKNNNTVQPMRKSYVNSSAELPSILFLRIHTRLGDKI